MAKHPRATATPFSSMVGSSVLLHDENGQVEAQLSILGVADSGERWGESQRRIAAELTRILNSHEELVKYLEVLRDREVELRHPGNADEGKPFMNDLILDGVNRALKAAGR